MYLIILFFFSDKPDRVVETVNTSNLVGNWGTGINSFSTGAPNDPWIVENTQSRNLKVAIIKSFDPVYDVTTNMLNYTIIWDNATTSINLPSNFGQTILAIYNVTLWNRFETISVIVFCNEF
ncbi:MAG: hypothetical protein R2685_16210 [Candidatus Nitrosocosmicus sp.]|nr:hypothetical protein [Candidatus Nitrosocosmicus sp.]